VGLAKLDVLRILVLWVFHDQVIECVPPPPANSQQQRFGNYSLDAASSSAHTHVSQALAPSAAVGTTAAPPPAPSLPPLVRPAVVVTLVPDSQVSEGSLLQLLPPPKQPQPQHGNSNSNSKRSRSDGKKSAGGVEFNFSGNVCCSYVAAGPEVSSRFSTTTSSGGASGGSSGGCLYTTRDELAEAGAALAQRLNLNGYFALFKKGALGPRREALPASAAHENSGGGGERGRKSYQQQRKNLSSSSSSSSINSSNSLTTSTSILILDTSRAMPGKRLMQTP